jgi:hypothetical protein
MPWKEESRKVPSVYRGRKRCEELDARIEE